MKYEDVKVGMVLKYTGWINTYRYTVHGISPFDGAVRLSAPFGTTYWGKDSNIWYNVSVISKPKEEKVMDQIKAGQKFQIGPSANSKLRVLTVTSVMSLGVSFAVESDTYTSGVKEIFVHFNDKDFWVKVQPYKEKIVHKKDLIWWEAGTGIHASCYPVGYELSEVNTELSRTTVEYIEEK